MFLRARFLLDDQHGITHTHTCYVRPSVLFDVDVAHDSSIYDDDDDENQFRHDPPLSR